MRRILFLAILLFVSISCTKTEKINSFDKFISELEQVTIEDSLRIESDDSPLYKPFNMTVNEQGRAIVAEGERWTLHLMNEKGDFWDETGGKGRGPNEYTVINQIHIGSDNQLHVYDSRSQAITIYSISEDQFQLDDEINLPKYDDGLRLKAIYKTNYGFIGVFKGGLGAIDSEQTLEVYRLGENLQLQDHLFDMPGNETYMSDLGFQRENPLGRKTIWGMTGGEFYYSNSNDLSVTSVDFASNKSTIYEFSDIPKPIKGKQAINAIESRVSPDPEMKELIREGKHLPYFIDFLPTQNHFYYTLFRPGATNGVLLRINKETKEMKKIIVPSVFNLYAVNGNTLYGIDYTTSGAPEIMILKLAS